RKVRFASSSLLGPFAVPLVGNVVLERGEKEGAEAAAAPIGTADRALLEECYEEALGEVPGGVRILPAPANEGVDGRPVRLAERREGVPPGLILEVAGGEHDAPLRGPEPLRCSRGRLLFPAILAHAAN